jgi:hypothetical protein
LPENPKWKGQTIVVESRRYASVTESKDNEMIVEQMTLDLDDKSREWDVDGTSLQLPVNAPLSEDF